MPGDKHIVFVTTGQPSSNPRMTKEAIALANAGYKVTVLYSFWVAWAYKQDIEIIKNNNKVNWIEVGGNPINKKRTYFYSRLCHKFYRILSSWLPLLVFEVRAEMRTYNAMLRIASQLNADLYVAHNLGALAVAGKAALRRQIFLGFDAEDFHRGQTHENSREYKRTKLIEDKYLPAASYITAASPLIAAAYKKLYSIEPVVINNVFSSKYLVKAVKPVIKPVKLFWFSQTVGHQRGLEDIIQALRVFPSGVFELTVLGYCSVEMKLYLQELGRQTNDDVTEIKFLDPVHPDEIFSIAATHDIGFATEPGRDENNRIALSNKLFTYLLAGNAVILSATPAQLLFYNENPDIGTVYQCGDINGLAAVLKRYIKEPELIMHQKKAALQLAAEKYNWEKEQQILLNCIRPILN